MVIIQHYAHSAKYYAEASPFLGHLFALPDRCPHPDCQAVDSLIRWGTYERQARTAVAIYWIEVQRVRCKACEHTHSLLPDFLHPYRHYVIQRLQEVVSWYLLGGLSINAIMSRLTGRCPGRSTVREWIRSFGYGAGVLIFDVLCRWLMQTSPLSELPKTPPPQHLDRVPGGIQRHRLTRAHRFWHLAERVYAQVKVRLSRLHFSPRHLLPFVLHWLQRGGIPPRLFWSPRLSTTPTEPF